MRSLVLWVLGVPISIIILLNLFKVISCFRSFACGCGSVKL